MDFYNNGNGFLIPEDRVISFDLMEQIGFQNQFHRGYEATLSPEGLEDIGEYFERANVSSCSLVTNTDMAKLESPIKLEASGRKTDIINGWNNRRLYFDLKVESQTTPHTPSKIFIYTGYTDIFESSRRIPDRLQQLDPETMFKITSVSIMKNYYDPYARKHQYSYGETFDVFNKDSSLFDEYSDVLMRPYDTMLNLKMREEGQADFYNSTSSFSNITRTADVKNNDSTTYTTELINNLSRGRSMLKTSSDATDMYHEALSLNEEHNFIKTPLGLYIKKVYRDERSDTIALKDLLRLYPGLDDVTSIVMNNYDSDLNYDTLLQPTSDNLVIQEVVNSCKSYMSRLSMNMVSFILQSNFRDQSICSIMNATFKIDFDNGTKMQNSNSFKANCEYNLLPRIERVLDYFYMEITIFSNVRSIVKADFGNGMTEVSLCNFTPALLSPLVTTMDKVDDFVDQIESLVDLTFTGEYVEFEDGSGQYLNSGRNNRNSRDLVMESTF